MIREDSVSRSSLSVSSRLRSLTIPLVSSVGGDSFRFAIDRARFDGDEGLVAADRVRHFDLDRDQALDAESYFATNFDVDKLQGIDESDFLQAIKLSGDGMSRRNIGIGHSGLWRRQLDDDAQGADDGGAFDITFDDDDVGWTTGAPASAASDSIGSELGLSPGELSTRSLPVPGCLADGRV